MGILNDRAIKVAPVGTHRAGDNLYLRVTKTGTKTFYARFLHNKRAMWKSLGTYPDLTLADARTKTGKLIKSINSGTQAADDALRTVKSAFDDYYLWLQTQYRQPEETDRILQKDVIPVIGSRMLDQLTRSDCSAVLRNVLQRGKPVMANRTMETMKRALDYCEQQGWIKESPMAGMKRAAVGGREIPRKRNLSFDEITELLGTLREMWKTKPHIAWPLRMILLTGLRSTEALNIRPDGRVKTKMDRIHRVPLTPHVRALLKIRPKRLPKSHKVVSQELHRMGMSFTPHDLRRTVASRLGDIGVLPHVTEKMLDHTMTGVMAVYNLAEYWPERVAAQRLWGIKLAALRRQSNKKPPD